MAIDRVCKAAILLAVQPKHQLIRSKPEHGASRNSDSNRFCRGRLVRCLYRSSAVFLSKFVILTLRKINPQREMAYGNGNVDARRGITVWNESGLG
jgi:hypothetical protein